MSAELEKQDIPTVANPVDFFLVFTFKTLMHSAMSAPELSITFSLPLRPIMLVYAMKSGCKRDGDV